MSKLIETARSYIGQAEDGTKPENTDFVNEEFEKELRGVGWQEGFAWCALFVRLCVKVGDSALWTRVKHHLTPSVLTTYYNLEKAKYTVHKEPFVGAICFMRNGTKYQGHVGIVSKVHDDGSFDLIEGNASPTNATRQGDTVAEKTWLNNQRPRVKGLYILGFIDLYKK